MIAYFDKQNLLSFIHSAKKAERGRWNDCMRMLNENFTILLTFSREDVKSFGEEDQEDVMLWYTRITDGEGDNDDSIRWQITLPQPVSLKTISSTSQFRSVYCMPVEAALSNVLLAPGVGDELTKLSSLFFGSYQFIRDIFTKVNKWKDLGPYISPCTDIIIVDKFVFASPDMYEANIYEIIRVLTQYSRDEKLNIVFFTLSSIYDKKTKTTFTPDWDTIYQKIRKCVNGRNRPNVTFITASDKYFEEHDRTIFTNYKLFVSGDTYNYFDSAGNKVTNGRWFHVHSLAEQENMASASKLLNDIQSNIDDLSKLNPDLIKKDKISNFLKFS